jgi:hypothetical protein
MAAKKVRMPKVKKPKNDCRWCEEKPATDCEGLCEDCQDLMGEAVAADSDETWLGRHAVGV